MFEHLVMFTGMPYVSWKAMTNISADALDDEYGEWGQSGVVSVK